MYRATAWANVADNAASSPLTNVSVALHTATLTAATNSQAENEVAYTNYARQNVARSTGWVAGSGGEPIPKRKKRKQDQTRPARTIFDEKDVLEMLSMLTISGVLNG